MQTGWVYNGGKWYYLTTSGAMKTGWQKDKNAWYYLAGNGAMVTAKWLKDTDGSWYYLAGSGKMLTGKQAIGGKAYTFKANGVWVS
jgi:lactocepin